MNHTTLGVIILILTSSALAGVAWFAVKEFKKWYDDK